MIHFFMKIPIPLYDEMMTHPINVNEPLWNEKIFILLHEVLCHCRQNNLDSLKFHPSVYSFILSYDCSFISLSVNLVGDLIMIQPKDFHNFSQRWPGFEHHDDHQHVMLDFGVSHQHFRINCDFILELLEDSSMKNLGRKMPDTKQR